MIGWESRMLFRHYLAEGLSKTAIAERLGISRRTVTRWIQSGALDRDLDEPPRYRPRPAVPRKLDPYREVIRTRLEAYPELSSVRLMEEIRAAGYDGGYTQLREFVRGIRPQPPEPVIQRFETAPGRQAQVDFADVTLPWGKRYALLVILGYSRLLWVRFFPSKDMRALLEGLAAAFAFLGGVPAEMLFDQMRSVITRDGRLHGERLVTNAEFVRCAAHYGFRVRACRPYRAQTKGKVERPVRYLRENFLYGRDFLNDADLDHQLRRWLDGVANARVHRTTREQPALRFERDERALLQPLPARPYASLVLGAARRPRSGDTRIYAASVPQITVERRPLTHYAELVGGAR
ncbi:MAG: IS21 family transposase [Gemmatimonadota bacterium]